MTHQHTYILYYSRLLAQPGIGALLYCLQILSLPFRRKNTPLYFSGEDRFLSRLLIQQCNKHPRKIVCTTTKIGFILKFFQSPILLDLSNVSELTVKSEQEFQNVLWSLTHAASLSKETVAGLEKYQSPLFRSLFTKSKSSD